jgi:hypothetical protein
MIGMLLRVCALVAADYQTFAFNTRPGSHSARDSAIDKITETCGNPGVVVVGGNRVVSSIYRESAANTPQDIKWIPRFDPW